MNNNYVAIMAGGIGSRFWPMSRARLPKQFLDILGIGSTLLQSTFERFRELCPAENIYILTNEEYKDLVLEQLPGILEKQVLCEPMRKNTAPPIAYFAYKIAMLDSEANMVISPADHLILQKKKFIKTLKKGMEFTAKQSNLLTIGIKPTRPDTGYGYIQFHDEKEKVEFNKVKTFTEKPNVKLAKQFVESGDFLWNAGIFLWNVKAIKQAIKEYLPEVNDAFKGGEMFYGTEKEKQFVNKAFSLCSNISVDYGIMEKASNVYVIPANFEWSDLGTWNSLYESRSKDYLGNAVSGKKVFVYDAENCMIVEQKDKLMVLQGLQNFIVVDTEDVLLICEMGKEQEIKQIVADLKRKKLDKHL